MGKRSERLRGDYSAVLNMELLKKQDPTKAKIPIHSPHTFLLLFQLALAFHGQTSRTSTSSAIISSLPTHSAPSHLALTTVAATKQRSLSHQCLP